MPTTHSLQSSIDVATKHSNRLFAGYIVALVVTALIVALFTYLTWNSSNKVQDAVQADANARIEEAKQAAGEAYKRAEELQQSNLNLRGQVATLETAAANAQKDVAALQKAATDSKAAQQRVERDLAKQRERAAIAEKDLANLRLAIQPRRLTDEQAKTLIGLLKGEPTGEVSITCVLGDSEGYTFATDIERALKAAGWTVKGGGIAQAVFTGNSPLGSTLFVHSAITAPSYAGRLQQAFFAIGIPLAGMQMQSVPIGDLQIVVGHKPTVKP